MLSDYKTNNHMIIQTSNSSKIGKIYTSDYSIHGKITDNKITGYGAIVYHNHPTLLHYVGNLLNNNKDGYGIEHYKNQSIYKGYFHDNMKHGNGNLYDIGDNNTIINGSWKNDELISKYFDRIMLKPGVEYWGEFIDNKPVGSYLQGVITICSMNNKTLIYIGYLQITKCNDTYDYIYLNGIFVENDEIISYNTKVNNNLIKFDIFDIYNPSIFERAEKYYIDFRNNDNINIDNLFSGNLVCGYLHKECSIYNDNFSIAGYFDWKADNAQIVINKEGQLYLKGTLNRKLMVTDIFDSNLNNILPYISDCTIYDISSGLLLFEGILKDGSYKNGILYNSNTDYYDKLYEGDFDNGVPHGTGTYYYPNGNIKYQGSLQSGCFEGEGSLHHEETGIIMYLGYFRCSMKHGIGTLFDSCGVEIYHGEFYNDNIAN